MYPVLILRSEFVCLVILVFLYFTSSYYHIDQSGTPFGRILRLAILHVIFDIITVLTVNHPDSIPAGLNWICHVCFHLSAIFFSNELLSYAVALCYPDKTRLYRRIGCGLIILYIISLAFLEIEYVPALGTYSSAGTPAVLGFLLAFSLLIMAQVFLFFNLDTLPSSIKTALIPMMVVLMIVEVCQMFFRSLLFTGGSVTIVTVGLFFSLENPVEVFRKKAMTDALTGVRSRASYEEEIDKYDQQFRESPGDEYAFVFFDLNNLRSVNNSLGHAEGDNYITLVASAISRCMKNCTAVYRIGGDEFLILYCRVDEDTVKKEIEAVQNACLQASEGLEYSASISAGYARSSSNSRSLREVVRSADYSMYRNKQRSSSDAVIPASADAQVNYSGLTGKMFDAICAASDRSYPFLMNIDTNVTRVSPGWKGYFGLEDEFFTDFTSVWLQYVHPDYRDGLLEDLAAVLNGHRKYHNYEYLARNADGDYVSVSCQGSIFRDSTTGVSYFSGFMINHGMEENIDPTTGLPNFDALTTVVCRYMDEGRPFSVMKLKLNSFARINMLYGYNGGSEVISRITEILTEELGGVGEIFSQASVDFSIFFETSDEQVLLDYYSRIYERCIAGLETDVGTVPVLISGGAFTTKGERYEIRQLRSWLVFALEESHYYRRNKLVFYREMKSSSGGTDISLLSQIHADALADMTYFRLRYQPIVDLQSGRTVGAEALLRWIHPHLGEVQPGQFIAFLENDPCYYRLGLKIIEQAVTDAAELRKTVPGFRVNVNITALQLQNEHFSEHVLEILEKHGFAPDGLMLELTERCKEMDSSFLARKIAELRSKGILVALDDMGTGYSTISLLMDIPVDEIKLDRDFVREMVKRESYRLFVRALVLGSSYGSHFTICFEGIEDREMLGTVSVFGEYLAQGYYFARPLLIEDFITYIARER
ncbi:MAG: EAL domain-containing protein [Clostridiales bacterium]|nr:EAL domain-containing protein [Candidatus Apopatocola equi]